MRGLCEAMRGPGVGDCRCQKDLVGEQNGQYGEDVTKRRLWYCRIYTLYSVLPRTKESSKQSRGFSPYDPMANINLDWTRTSVDSKYGAARCMHLI